MTVNYLGGEFVRIQFGDFVIGANPVSKSSKLRTSRFGAQLGLISVDHPDMNGIDQLTHAGKAPFVIDGPGEYEVQGVFVRGFRSTSHYGGRERSNSIYVFSVDGMNLCYLGALGAELASETKEALGDIDVLFTPIGGEGVLKPADAYRLSVTLEPRVIIPMHYGDVGEKNALAAFLKEAGEGKIAPIDKLTVKKKELDGKEGEIVVLSVP